MSYEQREHAARVKAAEQALALLQREQNGRVKDAEKALATAQQQYAGGVSQAERAQRDAEKAHQSAIKHAERQLQQAAQVGRNRVGSYGTIHAFQHAITTPQGTFPMNASVQATVDTAGNLATKSRVTLTRLAAGGLIAGPLGILVGAAAKKNSVVDTRELYLMVEGDGFGTVVQCRPDDGPKVRQLAMAINQAGKQADAASAAHDQAVKNAQQQLEQVRADTKAITDAEGRVAEMKAQTGPVQAMEQQLQAVRVDTGAIAGKQRELEATRVDTAAIERARASRLAIEAPAPQAALPEAPVA